MTRDEWLAAALADAPPLTDAQLAALRPIGQRMAACMNENAAPACTQEPRPGVTETQHERKNIA